MAEPNRVGGGELKANNQRVDSPAKRLRFGFATRAAAPPSHRRRKRKLRTQVARSLGAVAEGGLAAPRRCPRVGGGRATFV